MSCSSTAQVIRVIQATQTAQFIHFKWSENSARVFKAFAFIEEWIRAVHQTAHNRQVNDPFTTWKVKLKGRRIKKDGAVSPSIRILSSWVVHDLWIAAKAVRSCSQSYTLCHLSVLLYKLKWIYSSWRVCCYFGDIISAIPSSVHFEYRNMDRYIL